jgi:hypothetical protein
MSARPRTGAFPCATFAAPAAPAASRLDHVLKVGLALQAKYVDKDGKTVRYVEFKPGDPKQAYEKDCLSVPWHRFSRKKPSRVSEYVADVMADARLKEMAGMPPVIKHAFSTLQMDSFQNYINRMNKSRPVRIVESDAKWVMSWNSEYSRFCLVPIQSIAVEERLKEAIEFLETHMDDDALTGWRRREEAATFLDDYRAAIDPTKDQDNAEFRDTAIHLFKTILARINMETQPKWKRGLLALLG